MMLNSTFASVVVESDIGSSVGSESDLRSDLSYDRYFAWSLERNAVGYDVC